MYEISIVIPAYNESMRLPVSLKKILEFFSKSNYKFELIVVDDGSKDNTFEVAKNFDSQIKVIKLPKNSGKGAAVRAGMLAAIGDYVLFSDADLSTPIYEIETLLKEIRNGADFAIGSRALNHKLIKKHQPFYREWMGKIFNHIVQFLVVKGIKDTQCGFKMFKKEACQKVFPLTKIDGFSFDVELVYLADKLGLKIKEVPVEWYNDEMSKISPVRDSIRMFKEILKIKKLHQNI